MSGHGARVIAADVVARLGDDYTNDPRRSSHTLTYRVQANWKTVVDNLLECYHCAIAHRDFVSLVDMDTYEAYEHEVERRR